MAAAIWLSEKERSSAQSDAMEFMNLKRRSLDSKSLRDLAELGSVWALSIKQPGVTWQ